MQPVFSHNPGVRPPTVAGMFYPNDPDQLAGMVDEYLNAVEPVDGEPVALVVPHAGYVYSGPVAAYSYRQIQGVHYDTIIVIGNNHRTPGFSDISVWARGSWKTPLGEVHIDETLAAELLGMSKRIIDDPTPHMAEHSIEVQLPFLQRACPNCNIVPILIGRPSKKNIETLNQALTQVLADKKALIIASTDFSHYPTYDDARTVDAATLHAIETMDTNQVLDSITYQMKQRTPNLGTCACGEGPLLTAMKVARQLGADNVETLHYANSGDISTGDQNRVVGYGSVMFWRWEPPILTDTDRQTLLRLARESIAARLSGNDLPAPPTNSPALKRRTGVFVTLHKSGKLRGCVGNMRTNHLMGKSVQSAAISAAFGDPRFPPLSDDEIHQLDIEISLLSPLRRIVDPKAVKVGMHGLVVRARGHSGLLLPRVATDRGWNRQQFLEAVCRKADLPIDAWKQNVRLYTFTTQIFSNQSNGIE